MTQDFDDEDLQCFNLEAEATEEIADEAELSGFGYVGDDVLLHEDDDEEDEDDDDYDEDDE